MNQIYRLVFNPIAGAWQAVSECARGRGKGGRAATRRPRPAKAGRGGVHSQNPQVDHPRRPRGAGWLGLGVMLVGLQTGGAQAQAFTGTEETSGPFASEMQTFNDNSKLNASAANAVSGGQQHFYDASTLNASATNAVSGGFQLFNNTSVLNASAANAVRGGTQIFGATSTSVLNALVANAVSGGTQIFAGSNTLNASAANAVSGGDQAFGNTSVLNASATNAVSGGVQRFNERSTLNASANHAVSGGSQSFYDTSALNASTTNAVSGGDRSFLNTSALNASATNAVSGGSQAFYDSSALNASATHAVSAGLHNFSNTSTLNASATNAVSGGSQFLKDSSALNASATHAVSGGVQKFSDTSALNASGANAISGGTQSFSNTSALNASAANAISEGTQSFFDSSALNALAANAVGGGLQSFSDTSMLNASAANAVRDGHQYFNHASALNASVANALSGGVQTFWGPSTLNASAANAVSGGAQNFNDTSTLDASAANAVIGGFQYFNNASMLNASAANAIGGGHQNLYDASTALLGAINAFTRGAQVMFSNENGGVGGTLVLNGFSTDIGSINSALTGSGVIVNNGTTDAVLTVDGSTVAADSVFSGILANTNASGTGTLALVKDGGTKLTLSGANTFTGGTTVKGGTLAIGDAGSLADTGAVALTGSGATFSISGANGLRTIGALSSTLADTFVQLGNNRLIFGDASNQTFAGSVSGTGSGELYKQGSGAFTLTGTNDAALFINAGTVALSGAGSLSATRAVGMGSGAILSIGDADGDRAIGGLMGGTATSTVALGDNTLTLSTSANQQFNGAIQGEGGLLKTGAGTSILAGGNSYTGGTTVSGGRLALSGTGTLASAGSLTVNDGAVFDIAGANGGRTIGTLTGTTGAQLGLGARQLTVNQSGASTFAGAILGSTGSSLVKEGVGTLTLTGTSTYTGVTTVNDGTLLVGNAGTGSVAGDVQVNSTGTLGGSGSIGGNVAVASGGTLSPGNSPGTLTIGGDLTLNAGSTTKFDLGQAGAVGGASNDLVSVGGKLTLGGALQAQAASAGWYRLFNYDGTLSGGFDSTQVTSSQPGTFTGTVNTAVANQVNLSVLGAGQTMQFWNGANSTDTKGVQGGSGTWANLGTNWTDASGEGARGWGSSVGVFGGTSAGTVTVQGPQSFDTLQFTTDGYSLAADAGTPGSGLVISPATGVHGTVNTLAGIGASIAAPIADGAGNALVKVGRGTLTLSGTNTYWGGTGVNGGTLVAAGNSALGTGAVTIDNQAGDTATLQVNSGVTLGQAIVLANGGALDNAGTLSGSGSAVTGVGTVTNRDGGTIFRIDTSVALASGTVNNLSGSSITGASNTGVFFTGGGRVLNDGAKGSTASAIAGGLAGVRIEGAAGSVTNTGGATITGGLSAGVVMTAGGTVRNEGAGSSIRGGFLAGVSIDGGAGTLTNTQGASIGATLVGVQLLAGGSVTNGAGSTMSGGISSVQGLGAATTLANAGTLTGAVRLDGNFANHVTLSTGSRLAGDLDIGTQAASSLTLDGTGTERYGAAVSGATTFAGALVKTGSGTWTVDAALAPLSTTIAEGTLALGGAGTLGGSTLSLAGATGALDLSAATGSQSIGTLTGVAGSTIALGANPLTVTQGIDGRFDGRISGTGEVVKQGSGTLTLGAANAHSGGTRVLEGRLDVGHNEALGTGTLDLADGTTLGFAADGLSIANAIVMSGVGDPVFDTGRFNATVAGAISGSGFLTKEGTGTLTLSGTNTYTGATGVAQGTLKAGAMNTFSAASAHTVAAGATLDLAGFSQRVASLTNSGTVHLTGATPGTVLTVTGPWVGNGGTLALGTQLGSDGSPTDKLLLSGASAVASGSTKVAITNLGGLGGLTTGKGIAVVGTENGASVQGGAFALAAPVLAGAYDYQLHSTSEGAYLSSTSTTPVPGPGPTPDPAPTGTPRYRAEVPLFAALPEQLRQANLAMLGSMHQRIGDAGVSASSNNESGRRQGWGRILTVDREIAQGGTASPTSRGRLTGFQAGTDLWATPDWRAGVYVGQLEGDMKISGFARGIAGYDVGQNALKNQYLGGYLTYRTDSGFYADTVLQAGRHRSTAGGLGIAGSSSTGSSLLASVEVGQSLALGAGWTIEPQLQLVHQSLNLDDTGLVGATVQQQPHTGWAVRAGLRVQGEFATGAGSVQPYARLNVWRTASGSDRTRFIGPAAFTDIATPTGGTSTELALGAHWQVSPAVGVYGELGQLWASGGSAKTRGGPNASLGVKVRW